MGRQGLLEPVGLMKRALLALGLALALNQAQAQPAPDQAVRSQLIEVDLGRSEGFFSKSPVSLRALALTSPNATSSGTALLWFRGWPGIAQIKDEEDWKRRGNLNFLLRSLDIVLQEGITLVLMDCPSDQGGVHAGIPVRCNDNYRQSLQHADDVRQVMKHLRETRGIQRIFIMGHSYGSISSRWLAIHLGDDIQGSIHSASMTGVHRTPNFVFASSVPGMDMGRVKAPYVFMHSADDRCGSTPYAAIEAIAGPRLITLRGGEPTGDICGGTHYHSYRGIEASAARAVVDWIRAQSR